MPEIPHESVGQYIFRPVAAVSLRPRRTRAYFFLRRTGSPWTPAKRSWNPREAVLAGPWGRCAVCQWLPRVEWEDAPVLGRRRRDATNKYMRIKRDPDRGRFFRFEETRGASRRAIPRALPVSSVASRSISTLPGSRSNYETSEPVSKPPDASFGPWASVMRQFACQRVFAASLLSRITFRWSCRSRCACRRCARALATHVRVVRPLRLLFLYPRDDWQRSTRARRPFLHDAAPTMSFLYALPPTGEPMTYP